MDKKTKAWLLSGACVIGASSLTALMPALERTHFWWAPIILAAIGSFVVLLINNPWRVVIQPDVRERETDIKTGDDKPILPPEPPPPPPDPKEVGELLKEALKSKMKR